MPKVSVITICYNEPNLEKTCESIVNQTYQDFEWVVVDGGSNQETLDIFEKYKHRINTFISEKDNGIYNAMNKGIKLAHGEYLNFLNAGDYYHDNSVLQQTIDSDLDKDIVYGNTITVTDTQKNILPTPDSVDLNFFINSSLSHQSSFIKKELFDKYGLYNESYKIVSDWEKWLVFIIFNNCTYKHIGVTVAEFNLNGISVKQQALNMQERTQVFTKYYTGKDLQKILKLQRKAYKIARMKFRYKFWEYLFSIKNSPDKTHKIITIFGFKIKIRSKK